MENVVQPNIPPVQPPPQTPIPVPQSTNWLKIFLFILLGLVVVAGSVFVGIQTGKKQITEQRPTPTIQETLTPTAFPTQTQVSTITPIDDIWNLYTNNKLGFSMKVPKIVAGNGHNNCPDNYTVPVTVYDDNTGAYITVEYFYEYPQNNICQKTTNNLGIIDQRANQWKNGQGNPLFVPSNWHIVVSKVENDSELEQFIQASWGTGCKLGTKTKTTNGTYDIRVTGDGLDLDETKCPINFAMAFKYSPEFKKAATWAMGQDIVFSSAGYKQTYDEEMVNSFIFTN